MFSLEKPYTLDTIFDSFPPLQVTWIFGPTNIGSEEIKVKKNFGSKKYLSENSLVEKMRSIKIKAPKKLGPQSLVKIGSVIAEILLIWTNVTGTYVAWTNVTLKVGIC